MKIEEFRLERWQSVWENEVEVNLTESGVHPYTLRELLSNDEVNELLDIRLSYGWTNGSPSLREAILQYYPDAASDQVLITNGSAEANFLAMWSTLQAGDEIALMLPNYMQIWGLARALGVTVRPFYLHSDGTSWNLDRDELERAVSDRTKAIVVCNPNNPTGSVLSREEERILIDLAERTGCLLYVDEIYRGVELDGREGLSFWSRAPKVAIAGGTSKALAHPGLRIGWLVAERELIAEAWHRNDYTTITTSVLSEKVAEKILEPATRQRILERNRRMLRRNLELLIEWIGERPDRLQLVPPEAGGMAFLHYNYDVGSSELAKRLRDEHSVLVVPGDVYGLDHYLRIGIGEQLSALQIGLERLGVLCDTLD